MTKEEFPCACGHPELGHLKTPIYYRSRGEVLCLHCMCLEYIPDNLVYLEQQLRHKGE